MVLLALSRARAGERLCCPVALERGLAGVVLWRCAVPHAPHWPGRGTIGVGASGAREGEGEGEGEEEAEGGEGEPERRRLREDAGGRLLGRRGREGEVRS